MSKVLDRSVVPPFNELLIARRQEGFQVPEALLTLDPGGTIGWSFWTHGRLQNRGQADGTAQSLQGLLATWNPTRVVYESYRLYPWQLKQQSWSELPTVKLIGALEFLLEQRGTPATKQSAGEAKGFATTPKLKAWGLYVPGKPHATDAIRHGVYYLLAGGKK